MSTTPRRTTPAAAAATGSAPGRGRTVTDDMVERAAQAAWEHVSLFRKGTPMPSADSTDANQAGMGKRYRRAQRAALEAALNPKEAP